MPTPEQVFLARHYDENAKKPDRDPRGAFRNPTEGGPATAGIVGPLGSSSFTLPNVERALTDMEQGSSANASQPAAEPNRKMPRPTRAPMAPLSTGGATVTHGLGRSTSGSPSNVGSPSPTGGQTQHEVLQNFFQSLLSSKDRAGAAAAASRTTAPAKPTNGAPAPPADESFDEPPASASQ